MTQAKKHERLKTVAVTTGILVFITMICMGISFIGSVTSIRTTEPYKHSVELALENLTVRQALGDPMTVGWFTQGAVNVANGGEAQLYIPLRGTKASATIRVNATNRNGTWKYWAVRVDTEQGEHIDLLEP